MNSGSFSPDLTEFPVSPLIQFGIPLAVAAMAIPSVSQKVGALANQIWQKGLPFLQQKFAVGFNAYVPSSIQKFTGLTGGLLQVVGKTAYYGVTTLDEMVDFANLGGTKNPLASIDVSHQRLNQHDQRFAGCCEFLAEQAAQYYANNQADDVKDTISKAIRTYSVNEKEKDWDADFLSPFAQAKSIVFDQVANGADWFMSMSQELIMQTIKANILHLLANLADQAFASNHPFADQQCNPFGRLVSIIINCLAKYEDRLANITQLPEDQQAVQYREAFQEISSDLLAKCFPNGSQDIQLFHHTIPVKLIKQHLWNTINQELPVWLEHLYLQTRPLSEEYDDWKEQFNDEAYGLEADQLLPLPSTFIQHFIRSNQARDLDALEPILESLLEENGLTKLKAQHFSVLLIKYAREFLLTKDPALHKMGAFFERYLMEHLLFNLSIFVPDDVDDDSPMLLYILKTWINGGVFTMLSSTLSGQIQKPADQAKAIVELLAPFGLDQKEKFPLPPILKDHIWPAIQTFQQQTLPQVLAKVIPQWMALGKMKKHQSQLISWLYNDYSLTDSISKLSKRIIDEGMFQLIQANVSIGTELNHLLSSPFLSQDQVQKLDMQWEDLLKNDDPIDVLKDFGKQCLEALVLQLCKDLYKNYQKSIALDALDPLVDDIDEEDGEEIKPPFVAWLFLEVVNACNHVAIEGMNASELAALKKAIHLKNAIHNSKNLAQATQDRVELKKVWTIIQPKFVDLCRHLLGILGYHQSTDLPFPEKLQTMIWKKFMDVLSYVLFEHMGDLMLPLLEKQTLEEQVLALPQGELISQGCQLLAQDIVQHLPNWVEGKVESLPEQLMDKVPELDLLGTALDYYLINTANAILNVDDPAYEHYEPLWEWVQSYLEGLFLKLAVKVDQMNQQDLNALQSLVQNTRDELLSLEEQEDEIDSEENDDLDQEQLQDQYDQEMRAILVKFTDQLFACLGIRTNQDLFGVPQILQEPILKGIKGKFAQGLLRIYRLENKIRHHVVIPNPIEEHLPSSEVARASLALIRFVLDKATEQLTERVDGKALIIDQLYDPLKIWLGKQEEKGYQIATLLQTVIDQQIPNPLLVNLLDLLNTASAQGYKQNLADWINPVLTDQVIQHLTPLLEKEQEGQAAFDQELLMALLPVLIQHLKHLNQASHTAGGLNFENFLDVVGNEIHPAVPYIIDEEQQTLQRKEHFYNKQTDLIFALIFPEGKEDLAKIMPEIELSEEQWTSVSDALKDQVATQLPNALKVLFNKEMLVEIFSSCFEIIIAILDQPIQISDSNKTEPLTEEEEERQSRMDQLVGELVIEAARFIDLPVDMMEKFSAGAQRMIGINSIQKNVGQSIGAAMRTTFNGKVLVKIVQPILSNSAKQKYVKKSEQERLESQIEAVKHLKQLEKKLAGRSLAYIFRYLGTRFAKATDIFTDPVSTFLRKVILTIGSFVMVKLIGPALRFFKIERFVVNRLHEIIQYASDKSIAVFSQPKLHEDLIYYGVEAFEEKIGMAQPITEVTEDLYE